MFKETDMNNIKKQFPKNLNILIADDNKELSDIMAKFLDLNDIKVTDFTYDGLKTLESMINKRPDIVILDDNLPHLDCIEILEKIHAFYKSIGVLPIIPFIIVTASKPCVEFKEKSLELGAKHYIPKPIDTNFILKAILSYGKDKSSKCDSSSEENAAVPKKSEEKPSQESDFVFNSFAKTSRLLNKIGIAPNNLGYKYLRDAIVTVILDPDKINYLTKDLYPSLSYKYGKTFPSIERAIRHSIKSTWDKKPTSTRIEMFNDEVGEDKSPSGGEFIAVVSEYIRFDIETPQ